MIARKTLSLAAILVTTTLGQTTTQAAEYSLTIQPILPQETLKEYYQPLASYLSKRTGHTIKLSTHRNFLFYWTKMRRGNKGFDIVLDAAHFTDYRVKNQGYTVLAKIPDTVSYSVVTSEDNLIFEAEELIGLRVATMPSPSLGSLRLEELFPNPMRIPHYVWETNTTIAVDNILAGKIDAAIIPTRIAAKYENLNTVITTKPVPHMAVSTSPQLPVEVANKIRLALIEAHLSKSGKALLAHLKIEQFEPTDNATYDGYEKLLAEVFGYQASK